jgi:hypothetical protein
MERATGDSAGEKTDAPGSDPLGMLRWNWGEAYDIEIDGSEWRARRRDGLGGWITAYNADDLCNQILTDYMRKPVPRPPSEN